MFFMTSTIASDKLINTKISTKVSSHFNSFTKVIMTNTYDSLKLFIVLMKLFGVYRFNTCCFAKRFQKLNNLFQNLPAFLNFLVFVFLFSFSFRLSSSKNIWNFCTFAGFLLTLIIVGYQRLKWKEIENFVNDLIGIDQQVVKKFKLCF